jgi:hypothetical protein
LYTCKYAKKIGPLLKLLYSLSTCYIMILLLRMLWIGDWCTVIRFEWVSAKFGTCTVVSVSGTLVEAQMCVFALESTHFFCNKCPIYKHDGASNKFSTNSHGTDYSVWQQHGLTLYLCCCGILLRKSCYATAGFLVLSAVAACCRKKVLLWHQHGVVNDVSLLPSLLQLGMISGMLTQQMGIWHCLITVLLLHHVVTTWKLWQQHDTLNSCITVRMLQHAREGSNAVATAGYLILSLMWLLLQHVVIIYCCTQKGIYLV